MKPLAASAFRGIYGQECALSGHLTPTFTGSTGPFTCPNMAAMMPSSPWCNPALLRGGVYIRDSDDSEAG
jgi:hypothetical protein